MPDRQDRTQRGRAFTRGVRESTADIQAGLDSLIEQATIVGTSGGAGSVPTATTDEQEPVQVYEAYGFASSPAGSGQALVFAPGGEESARVALGVSTISGRPATAEGDVVLWTDGGHTVALDDDGGVLVTAKDGSTIDLDTTGAITMTAATGSDVTINVSAGAFVNIGGAGAVKLITDALESYLATAFTSALVTPGDGGSTFKTWMASRLTGVPPGGPPALKTATATTRARGV